MKVEDRPRDAESAVTLGVFGHLERGLLDGVGHIHDLVALADILEKFLEHRDLFLVGGLNAP